jgi:hypothetical protein
MMPTVKKGGKVKRYPYTKEGKRQAEEAAKATPVKKKPA